MSDRLMRKFINLAPDSVKANAIDFADVVAEDGRTSLRVTLDRLLTDEEKGKMKRKKCFVGLDFIAHHKYAPEIQRSYFYVV